MEPATPLLGGLGGRLTERTAIAVLAPPLAFWLGGLAALYWHDDGVPVWGWGIASVVSGRWGALHGVLQDFCGLSELRRVLLMVGVVVLSATVARRFELPLLRWAEGYWPRPLRGLGAKRVAAIKKRGEEARERRRELGRRFDAHDDDERRQYNELNDLLTRYLPANFAHLLPTALGNRLRAAEHKPETKYGLEVFACWPRLWLLLPDGARAEVAGARSRLDDAVLGFFWCLIFPVWSVWAWWAAPVGAVAAFAAYRRLLSAADSYGVLLESAFDVYRSLLYRSLRWAEPETPAAERGIGEQLTAYLVYGPDEFTPPFGDYTGPNLRRRIHRPPDPSIPPTALW